MTPVALVLAALLVAALLAVSRRRPEHGAAARLRGSPDVRSRGRHASAPRSHAAAIEHLGATLRRVAGRTSDPAADRRLGTAAVLALGLAPVDPVVAIAGGGVAWLVSWWRAARRAAGVQREIDGGVADLVDLLRIGVTAGLGVRAALAGAVEHLHGPLVDRVERALLEAERGRPLVDALDAAAVDLGATPRLLLDALVAGERHGAPLDALLGRVADDARRRERHRAERAARRLPVTLLFPLVCCALPAFALLTVVPVVVSTLAALEG